MRSLSRGAVLLLMGAALTGCVNNANTTRSTSNKPTKSGREVAASNPVDIGKPAPDIVGVDADGKQFRLSEYRGKVVLLDFWASW
jgi:cytochrome oxidase Cu insertion factor (SCO1/SenC/PrrC family)